MEAEMVNPEAAVQELRATLVDPDISKMERALSLTEALLTLDRDNAGLCFCMAVAYMRQRRSALAEHWYHRALALEPNLPEAYNNLGFTAQQEGNVLKAQEYFDKALAMDPDSIEFMNNKATSYINNGTPDKAIYWCDKVLEKDPNHVDAAWNKGLALLEKGEWAEGWRLYAYGLDAGVASSQSRKIRHYGEANATPYWDGTKGQRVVVYGEQGVGDEIMAVSMLEDLAKDCEHVVYEAHPRLFNIMRHSLKHLHNVTVYGTRKQEWQTLDWPTWHEIDAKIPIIQLGQFYRPTAETFPKKPYLLPFTDKVDLYKGKLAMLGRKPKIGLSWKGGSGLTRNDLRSLGIGSFENLIRAVDAEWISLQYDPADKPGWNEPIVKQFNADTGLNIHHWPDVINNLDEDYGGLIHALDLIISVNTSLVHACGAYGVTCWTLTPSKPAWRYGLTGREMPWYGPWVQQMRQTGDDWGPVLKYLETAIPEYLSHKEAA